MKFLLDTNVYVAAIQDPDFMIRHRAALASIAPLLYLSSVVRFELLRGARGEFGRARVHRATRQLERAGRVVAPLHEDWISAGVVQGKIWDEHPRLRSKDLANDILIACAARRLGAAVVTYNRKDFELVRQYLAHKTCTIEEIASI